VKPDWRAREVGRFVSRVRQAEVNPRRTSIRTGACESDCDPEFSIQNRTASPVSGQNKWWPSHHPMPAMKAAAGMVKIHAHTMLPATPQRTAETLRVEPTPTMAPVIV